MYIYKTFSCGFTRRFRTLETRDIPQNIGYSTFDSSYRPTYYYCQQRMVAVSEAFFTFFLYLFFHHISQNEGGKWGKKHCWFSVSFLLMQNAEYAVCGNCCGTRDRWIIHDWKESMEPGRRELSTQCYYDKTTS